MKQFILGIWNGFGEIWSHKLRSFLTLICVCMGVASLVLIVGLINGLFANWKNYMKETGAGQKVQVYSTSPPKRQEHLAALSPGPTMADAEAIQQFSRYAQAVSPQMQYQAQGVLRRKGKTVDWEVQLLGVTQAVLPLNKHEVVEGRFIADLDLAEAEPVIVLGSKAVKVLYEPNEKVMGTQVFINDMPFTVIGLLKDYQMYEGKYNYLDRKNRFAYIPITTMQRRLSFNTRLSSLEVQLTDVSKSAELISTIENVMFHMHRGIHDFETYADAENAQEANKMETNFMLVGGGIGVVTLLVGGIGIMNLMLASINERIREIGIRKALGAWNRDIFVQFIAESVSLATMGGAIGVLGGVAAVRFMDNLMKGGDNLPPPVVSTMAVAVGFGFSVLVGIVAGLYPAFRASRLDPIEALRYE